MASRGISVLLGFLAPLLKGSTGIHGGFAIGAAMVVMHLIAFAIARGLEGLLICLTMSALGLVSGAMLGFTATWALTHLTLPGLMAAQLAVGTFLLARTFRRELRPMEKPPIQIQEADLMKEFEGMSSHEIRAHLENDMAQMIRELDQMSRATNFVLGGAALGLIAVALVFFGSKLASTKTVVPTAMILSLALVLFGRRALGHRES
jgi:hypothetical protein